MTRSLLHHAARRAGWGDDAGQVTVFVVILFAAIVWVAGLVYDGGQALGAKNEAVSQAQSAARAGAQQLDLAAYRAHGAVRLDPTAAATAAREYLTAVGADGSVTATTNRVRVTVTARSQPRLLTLLGVGPIEVTGIGSAHPRRGDTPGGGPP